MSAFNWKELVKTAAPVLGTVISGGNPLGGAALKVLAEALTGDENASEEDISSKLASANPEVLVKVKEAEQNFESEMAKIGLNRDQIVMSDKDSARKRQSETKDDMPNVIFVVLSLMVIGVVCLISFADLDQTQLNFLLPISGAIMTAWIGSCQYFNGTTLGSAKKNEWKMKK